VLGVGSTAADCASEEDTPAFQQVRLRGMDSNSVEHVDVKFETFRIKLLKVQPKIKFKKVQKFRQIVLLPESVQVFI